MGRQPLCIHRRNFGSTFNLEPGFLKQHPQKLGFSPRFSEDEVYYQALVRTLFSTVMSCACRRANLAIHTKENHSLWRRYLHSYAQQKGRTSPLCQVTVPVSSPTRGVTRAASAEISHTHQAHWAT